MSAPARLIARIANRKRLPKPDDVIQKWKIVRGDTVQIVTGKDAGKRGTVLKVIRARNRCIVTGLNLVKKHTPRSAQARGSVITKEAAIHVSNLSLLDPVSGKPTRVRWQFLDEETAKRDAAMIGDFFNPRTRKVRIAVRSGAVIPRPPQLKLRRRAYPTPGPKDTSQPIAKHVTYVPPSYVPPPAEPVD